MWRNKKAVVGPKNYDLTEDEKRHPLYGCRFPKPTVLKLESKAKLQLTGADQVRTCSRRASEARYGDHTCIRVRAWAPSGTGQCKVVGILIDRLNYAAIEQIESLRSHRKLVPF